VEYLMAPPFILSQDDSLWRTTTNATTKSKINGAAESIDSCLERVNNKMGYYVEKKSHYYATETEWASERCASRFRQAHGVVPDANKLNILLTLRLHSLHRSFTNNTTANTTPHPLFDQELVSEYLLLVRLHPVLFYPVNV
jgi:hypothetical protein